MKPSTTTTVLRLTQRQQSQLNAWFAREGRQFHNTYILAQPFLTHGQVRRHKGDFVVGAYTVPEGRRLQRVVESIRRRRAEQEAA